MDVILLERVEKLGQMGDEVTVKDGFARNYLLPRKKAIRANEQNRKRFETQRTQLEADNLARKQEAEAVAGKMTDFSVIMIRQAGDSGQLYGSVNARDVAEGVTEAGVTIDRRQVVLDQAIKTLGLYPVRLALHPEVTVEITVNVARSQEEARLQAAGIDVNAMDDDLPDQADQDAAADAEIDPEQLFEPEAVPDDVEVAPVTMAEAAEAEPESEPDPAAGSAADDDPDKADETAER